MNGHLWMSTASSTSTPNHPSSSRWAATERPTCAHLNFVLQPEKQTELNLASSVTGDSAAKAMDPVTAFTVAGTVLQFLDTACHFAKLAYRLYKPGPGDVLGYSDLRKITESLSAVLPTLEGAASGGDNGTEKSLKQLARDCSKTASQLLEKVKIPDPGRKRDALKHGFCLIWKEDEIKSLQERLTSFRSQLNLHLLLSIRQVLVLSKLLPICGTDRAREVQF